MSCTMMRLVEDPGEENVTVFPVVYATIRGCRSCP
jgi:hypothetical protein